MLSNESRKRLNAVFAGLWSNRQGVRGSWGASSYRYHPTYIHRRGLLLVGEVRLSDLYVVVPADAPLIRVAGDPRANCGTMPLVSGDGELIRVLGSEGPWWAILEEEIPLMEEELEASNRARAEATAAEAAERKAAHDAMIARAAAALTQ